MAQNGGNDPDKKQGAAPDQINVSIDLGHLEASPEQVKRLKAFVHNQVLTWIRADVNEARDIPISCFESGSELGEDDDEPTS